MRRRAAATASISMSASSMPVALRIGPATHGAAGRDDHRVAFVDPFVRVGIKPPALRKIRGQVAGPLDGSAADHPATSFACDVLQGADPAIAAVVRWRDIYFEALRVERVPRQRHEVFPANERADAPAGRVDDLRARSVAEL